MRLLLFLLSLDGGANGHEAYTSILYAPALSSPHRNSWTQKRLELVCVVAASSLQLSKMDPTRERVLLVNDVLGTEADTRSILEAGGWRLRTVDFSHRDPSGLGRNFSFPRWESVPPPPGVKVKEQRAKSNKALTTPEMLGRKNKLWDLRDEAGALYHRGLFFDADMLFLDTPKTRKIMAGVWKLPTRDDAGTRVIRATVRGTLDHCFSSAIVLFEPSADDFKALNRYLWDPDVTRLARCPGHDQRILNAVFAGRWLPLELAKASAAASKSSKPVVHFHNKMASPYLAGLWQELMQKAPPAVRDPCRALYTREAARKAARPPR